MRGSQTLFALVGAASLALSISACQQTKPHAAGAADVGAVKDAISADEKKMNEQFKGKDLEGLLGHYADDAFFIAPGLKGASSSTEIRKDYADALNDKNFNVTFGSDKMDVAASGDLAYTRGHFTETYTDPKTNKIVTDSGSYITVYKKQADGSWKAEEDFAAANPAG